jgi:hypothetical protein
MPIKKTIKITLQAKASALHKRYLRDALHRELDRILRQLREKDKKED